MVHLSMSPSQAKTVVEALDFFARMGSGQFSEILGLHWTSKNLEELEKIIQDLKFKMTGFQSGQSLGCRSPELPEKFKTSWDIMQVLRSALAWHEKPEGGFQVCFDPPLKTSQEEFPSVSIED